MTRALRIGAGVACLAAAAVALLLAVDVRAWQGRLAADDLRFRNVPARGGLWQPQQIVPFGAARRLLALDVGQRGDCTNGFGGRPRRRRSARGEPATIAPWPSSTNSR
jgi:hypothetical protein